MSETKTQQQVEADEAMRKAFELCTMAYAEPGVNPGVIVDAVAIVLTTRLDDEGEAITAPGIYFGGQPTPRYRLTGMLDEAQRQLEDGYDEDED